MYNVFNCLAEQSMNTIWMRVSLCIGNRDSIKEIYLT